MILRAAERPFGVRVKVLDFGAAKLPASLDGRVRTETGAIIGTPAYMSPEQCAREPAVDGKADVYALGIVLHQLLTTELPFRATLPFDYLAAHLRQPPQPLRDCLPSAPEALSMLLAAMLAKRPEARPNMTQVASRLEQLLEAPSSALAPPVRSLGVEGEVNAPSRTAIRSPRWLLIPLLLFVLLGVALLAMFLPQPRPRAVAQRARSEAAINLRTVRWHVESTPSGADVVSADDKLLGSTPWTVERPVQPGETMLTLRHPGHSDAHIVLQNQASAQRAVILAPLLAPPPAAQDAPVAPPTPHARGKGHGKRAKRDDVEVKLLD